MELKMFTEDKYEAREKWRQYLSAAKKTKSPQDRDLAAIYNQLKLGRKLVDIHDVIKRGGIHNNRHPKLAIAPALQKHIRCDCYQNGRVIYHNNQGYKLNIDIPAALPTFTFQGRTGNEDYLYMELKAPVPLVPPEHRPVTLRNDHYILWEVDKWEKVAPVDPWLLRRITKQFFIVLAQWDLTELERAVMTAYL